MELIGFSLVLIVSFYLLTKVCDDYFINSLDKIAHRFKMSHEAAGATLMAVGSSAAELFVAIIALIKPGDHAAIGMGTIVGSAIFNILVIIGATAVVRKVVLAWQPIVRDTVFYSVSIIALLLVFRDGQIELKEAAIFVFLYLVYVITVVKWDKIMPRRPLDKAKRIGGDMLKEIKEEIREGRKSKWEKVFWPLDFLLDKIFPNPKRYYRVFGISIVIIAGLSWVLVESAVAISGILHIPEAIIALTVLAIGTSIPDAASSIIVAKQGRGDMAISNAIGSNIFDILFGLGLPWFIFLLIAGGSIPVSTESLLSSVILLFATVLVIFFLLLIRKWKIGNKAGYFLIILYLGYLAWAITSL